MLLYTLGLNSLNVNNVEGVSDLEKCWSLIEQSIVRFDLTFAPTVTKVSDSDTYYVNTYYYIRTLSHIHVVYAHRSLETGQIIINILKKSME